MKQNRSLIWELLVFLYPSAVGWVSAPRSPITEEEANPEEQRGLSKTHVEHKAPVYCHSPSLKSHLIFLPHH